MNHFFKIIAFYLSVFLSSASLAQNDVNKTELITVTASRTATPLLNEATSIELLTENELEALSAQHINQALSQISGTWISRGNGQEHLTAIRSPVLTGAGSCGAFVMALDGISLRAPGFCNANQLFDVNSEQAARIEVLKGPQSTLYGSNAMHGVINVLTADALTRRPNSVGLEWGRDDFLRAKLAITGKEREHSFAIFSNITQHNGYQASSGYDQQKLTFIHQYEGTEWRIKSVIEASNLNQDTAGFVQGFEAYKDETLRQTNPNPNAYRDAKSLLAYSAFSKLTPKGEFTFTPYFRNNKMEFLQHFLPWQATENNKHDSLGFKAQQVFNINNMRVITGFDVDYTHAALTETQAIDFSPSIPLGIHYDYNVGALVAASFIQADWLFNDWTITAGARYEHTQYDYNNQLANGSACETNVPRCRFTRPADQKIKYKAFSPTFAISYFLSTQQHFYSRVSQGYRAPQATELFRLQNEQTTTDLDTEKLNAIEFGWKYIDAITQAQVSIFSMNKVNFIFQDTNRQNISNGQTKHRGIEISLQHAINQTLSFVISGSYANHKYSNDLTLSSVNIEGNTIDTSPQFSAYSRLNWQASPRLTASVSLDKLGQYYLNPENTAQYDGHTLLNFHANYSINNQLTVGANIFNALNEDYAERADIGFGNFRYFIGEPRRIFFNVKWRWL